MYREQGKDGSGVWVAIVIDCGCFGDRLQGEVVRMKFNVG